MHMIRKCHHIFAHPPKMSIINSQGTEKCVHFCKCCIYMYIILFHTSFSLFVCKY